MNQETEYPYDGSHNDQRTEGLLTVHYEGAPSYNIVFEPNFLKLAEQLTSLDMTGRKFMIVSDSTVSKLYLDQVIQLLEPISKKLSTFIFPAGEGSKTLDTVYQCYEVLIKESFDRNDILIALGGGVVGDLTGYVAATYLRGVRFVQIPTTLLSMVDSSIGGKTGVDFKSYKNMIGAFHQPKLVYINLNTILTLGKEFNAGMGEVIKHGLIKDYDYYQWLKENYKQILAKDYDALHSMIFTSCNIKRMVVENDPKEKGDRALLNFGHTIGHAVEKLKNFSLAHGDCVAIGMAAASYLSMERGYLTPEDLSDIIATLKSFQLPVTVKGLDDEEVYQVTRLDKKMDSDMIKFILLRAKGVSFIDPSLTKEELIRAIRWIQKD